MLRAPIASRLCSGSSLLSASRKGPGFAGALSFPGNTMARVKVSSFLLAFALAFPAVVFAAPSTPVDEDWSKSPEAYFLTAEEKQEWRTLQSRESRVDFIERYWLKRDPTPGTAANQFRDMVRARIKTADARYGSIDGKP